MNVNIMFFIATQQFLIQNLSDENFVWCFN